MFFDALHINTQWTLLQSVWAPLQPPAVAKKVCYTPLHSLSRLSTTTVLDECNLGICLSNILL